MSEMKKCEICQAEIFAKDWCGLCKTRVDSLRTENARLKEENTALKQEYKTEYGIAIRAQSDMGMWQHYCQQKEKTIQRLESELLTENARLKRLLKWACNTVIFYVSVSGDLAGEALVEARKILKELEG